MLRFFNKILGKQVYRIGFANLTENIPFCVDVRTGLEQAVQQAKDFSLLLADNNLDEKTALANADYFIAENVDLVIEYQINEAVNDKLMDKFRRSNIVEPVA